MLLISDMFACLAYFCLMLAQKAQPRLTGAIITSVILALLSHRRTISHRLRWAVLGAGTVWFDAKDIQSVASNYMGHVLDIVVDASVVDGRLFSRFTVRLPTDHALPCPRIVAMCTSWLSVCASHMGSCRQVDISSGPSSRRGVARRAGGSMANSSATGI
jgi:hypothetical protein